MKEALQPKEAPKPKEKAKEKPKEKAKVPEMTAAEKKIHDQIVVETSDLGNTLELFGGCFVLFFSGDSMP